MRVCVLGGGFAGLSASYYLSKKGYEVTLLEVDKVLGGLGACFKLGRGIWLERFYHHIFKSDSSVQKLAKSVGVKNKFIWRPTSMGFFHGGKIHEFTTPLHLLNFQPLKIMDKLRLGATLLYLSHYPKWEHLDKVRASTWLKQWCGERAYRIVWEPLLKIKFGDCIEEIPAAWVWGRVFARGHSRSSTMLREELGYVEGGFKVLIDAVKTAIEENGGKIYTRKKVVGVKISDKEEKVKVKSKDKAMVFDHVISTIPLPELLHITKGLSPELYHQFSSIKYQAVVCMKLQLTQQLSPVYWLNLSDPKLSIGGVIEHTNFIHPENYENSHICYIFNYLSPTNKLYKLSAQKLFPIYLKNLKRIFPHFKLKHVKNYYLHRTPYATVIYTLGYSQQIPPTHPVKNLWLATTAHVYPHDRTINNSVKLGEEVAKDLISKT